MTVLVFNFSEGYVREMKTERRRTLTRVVFDSFLILVLGGFDPVLLCTHFFGGKRVVFVAKADDDWERSGGGGWGLCIYNDLAFLEIYTLLFLV
jgi:hypothetical protein